MPKDARVQLADGCELVLAQPRFEGDGEAAALVGGQGGEELRVPLAQIRRLETRHTETLRVLANVVPRHGGGGRRGGRPSRAPARVSTVCSSVRVDRRRAGSRRAAPTTAGTGRRRCRRRSRRHRCTEGRATGSSP